MMSNRERIIIIPKTIKISNGMTLHIMYPIPKRIKVIPPILKGTGDDVIDYYSIFIIKQLIVIIITTNYDLRIFR